MRNKFLIISIIIMASVLETEYVLAQADEQVFNLNIIGRDDDTHIRMDVSFENLSIRRSFLIESLTGRYIADSGENNLALTIPGNHRFSMGHDGKISFSGELAFLMGISGSVSFYLVYPAKQKHHEE